MPVVVLPQLLLCGLLQPRERMAGVVQWLSDALPLSYAVQALQQVAGSPSITGIYWRDVIVVLGCTVVGFGLGAATLHCRTG